MCGLRDNLLREVAISALASTSHAIAYVEGVDEVHFLSPRKQMHKERCKSRFTQRSASLSSFCRVGVTATRQQDVRRISIFSFFLSVVKADAFIKRAHEREKGL